MFNLNHTLNASIHQLLNKTMSIIATNVAEQYRNGMRTPYRGSEHLAVGKFDEFSDSSVIHQIKTIHILLMILALQQNLSICLTFCQLYMAIRQTLLLYG